MIKKALTLLFLCCTLMVTATPLQAAPDPKVRSYHEFDNAIYYGAYESWGASNSVTYMSVIKYIDSNW